MRPPFERELLLAIYYAAAYLVFDVAATLLYMPYFALTPELTSDYDERTLLTSYRMFFSILGSLLAFTVPWFIIDSFHPQNAPRVLVMGIVSAFFYPLTRQKHAEVVSELERRRSASGEEDA